MPTVGLDVTIISIAVTVGGVHHVSDPISVTVSRIVSEEISG